MATRLLAWGPAAAWATVLFLLSAWSRPSVPVWFLAYDKLTHFGLYAVLGATLGYGRTHDPAVPSHALVLAAGVLYGVTDEWHQSFVYGRTPELGDWVADMTGVAVGYALAVLLFKRLAPAAPAPTPGADVRD